MWMGGWVDGLNGSRLIDNDVNVTKMSRTQSLFVNMNMMDVVLISPRKKFI